MQTKTNQHQVLIAVEIDFWGYFGMKQSPRNTLLCPLGSSDLYLMASDLSNIQVASSRVSISFPFAVPCGFLVIVWHVIDLCKFAQSHLQRGTSDLLGGLKRCFEGFVSPRNSLIINFLTASHLVPFLRQFVRKSVVASVESSQHAHCLQNMLSIFSSFVT